MNKKLIALGVIGSLGLGAAAILPLSVSADDSATSNVTTFVQKLAQKLGIEQAAVQTAVDSVRTDVKAEIEANFKAEVSQAVTDSKLTQRQADILLAIQANRVEPSAENRPDKSTFDSLTQEERQAKMEEFKTARETEMLTALNNAGLNTTLEEIQSTHEAAKTAELKIGFAGGRGHGGMGEMGEKGMALGRF